MPYTTARAALAPTDSNLLDSLVAEWDSAGGLAGHAAANLRAEHGFPAPEMHSYLAALVGKRSALSIAPPGPDAAFEQIRST
ncbi:MAG: hypothetical protein ACRD5L_18190, partial [Bryobacteraceae bacterium]